MVFGACSSGTLPAAAVPVSQAIATPAKDPVETPVEEEAVTEPVEEEAVTEPVEEEAVTEPVEEAAQAETAEGEMQQAKSISEIAKEDERFTTFAAGLDAAGLADTFAGEGEFTVFAPTEDAFAALPEGALDFWYENPQGTLKDVLQYHVVDGVVRAEEIVGLVAMRTLLGEDIAVSVEADGQIFLNGSAQVITDIEASNGVIHVIDAVLVPAAGLG